MIETYIDFCGRRSFQKQMKLFLKHFYCWTATTGQSFNRKQGAVRFIHYHHVFRDEVKGFESQIRFLFQQGQFISMQGACELLKGESKDKGTYFCVSFDDGLKSVYTHALSILERYSIPAIVYLPTDYIGLRPHMKLERERLLQFYPNNPKVVEFLSWDECREMSERGISFGSHTQSHLHLIRADQDRIRVELDNSKRMIERELGIPCVHFACPWGKPSLDYDPELVIPILSDLGYETLASSIRGGMKPGDSLMEIKRDHVLANWGVSFLKYFLGK